MFQSHVLVSAIGEAFRASRKEEGVGVGRDLIVEALRLKVTSAFPVTLRAQVTFHLLFLGSHSSLFFLYFSPVFLEQNAAKREC